MLKKESARYLFFSEANDIDELIANKEDYLDTLAAYLGISLADFKITYIICEKATLTIDDEKKEINCADATSFIPDILLVLKEKFGKSTKPFWEYGFAGYLNSVLTGRDYKNKVALFVKNGEYVELETLMEAKDFTVANFYEATEFVAYLIYRYGFALFFQFYVLRDKARLEDIYGFKPRRLEKTFVFYLTEAESM